MAKRDNRSERIGSSRRRRFPATLLLLSIVRPAIAPDAGAADRDHRQIRPHRPRPRHRAAQAAVVDNPENKFCGISHAEAYQFCHLEPHKSLPCPDGDEECPPGMPCWKIEEACTPPPVPTTPVPTRSPLSERSSDPSDHNFCGMGFDNLFQCSKHCPNGTPAECPPGQLCYFNTPCDARVEGSLLGAPTASPVRAPTAGPTVYRHVVTIGKSNFCGTDYNEASANCARGRNCPTGSNDECLEEMYCFVDVKGCDVNELPTVQPTISRQPTPSPSFSPTTASPTITRTPTGAPLDPETSSSVGEIGHDECPEDEQCFAQAGCKKLIEQATTSLTDEIQPNSLADSDQVPTPIPNPTEEPTHSPLAKDDYRNFFFCGTSWCFAQADCKKGVIEPKTSRPTNEPTPMPIDGTRSPTSSPAPTFSPTNPQPTISPLPPPTSSPAIVTESPTTAFPTYKPTFAPCAGNPCPNQEHCRSGQGFCGPGPYYCNEKSIWMASCGVPTDPPFTAAPTISNRPSKVATNPPTRQPTELQTAPPYAQEEEGPETSRPTLVNVDDQYFAPDDPLGSFFCGRDWNHAITDCPHRCPSGESDQCPEGWSCYAFTPCVGIGTNTPPTVKPTWEPTKKPTPKPSKAETPYPTTTQQFWTAQNQAEYGQSVPASRGPTKKPVWWTPAPSPKPSDAPTQDQCRGLPCDFEGECRSRLGFCGTGIVYCNSASSWVPSCGGGGGLIQLEETLSPNTVPTESPISAWEAWVAIKDENPDTDDADAGGSGTIGGGNSEVDADESSEKSEEDDESTYSGFDPDAWEKWDNKQSEKEEQTWSWWTTSRNSSAMSVPYSLFVSVSWTLLFMASTYL
ncbi:hypothetical protein ACHAWF_015751 [Thalassiosira exigua]